MQKEIQELIWSAEHKRMFKIKIPEPELILLRELAKRAGDMVRENNPYNQGQMEIASRAYDKWNSRQ